MKKILSVVILIAFVLSPEAFAKSRSTPKTSEKMQGKASRFSLKDPRVVLEKVSENKNIKEPEEKTLPKGAKGSPYSKGEQDKIDIIEDLIKSYDENNARPDGYGFEIQREIVVTLGKMKSKRALKLLIAKLNDEKEIMTTKMVIVEALGEIRDKKAEAALEKFLEYLNKNKPSDTMAGWSWEQNIKKTEEALKKVKGA